METTNESGGKIYAAQRLLKQRVRKVFTHSCAICYPFTSLLITLRLLTGTNFYSALMMVAANCNLSNWLSLPILCLV